MGVSNLSMIRHFTYILLIVLSYYLLIVKDQKVGLNKKILVLVALEITF